MDDREINKVLALAIGWKPEQMRVTLATVFLTTEYKGYAPREEIFDYTDPAVIWPIAAKYDCFPYQSSYDLMWTTDYNREWYDTPELAVAMEVINRSEAWMTEN